MINTWGIMNTNQKTTMWPLCYVSFYWINLSSNIDQKVPVLFGFLGHACDPVSCSLILKHCNVTMLDDVIIYIFKPQQFVRNIRNERPASQQLEQCAFATKRIISLPSSNDGTVLSFHKCARASHLSCPIIGARRQYS